MSNKSGHYFYSKRRIRCQDTGEEVEGYYAYLKTKHWRQLREKIHAHYGGVCCRCGESLPLDMSEIHHRSYSNLGKETEKDLALYCKRCHRIVENQKKKHKNYGKDFRAFLSRVDKQLSIEEKKALRRYITSVYNIE